jgi:hypothetical protein
MQKLLLVLTLAFLSGCSVFANDNNGFDTKQEAIEFGFKEEDIKKEDIIGEIEERNLSFIFYKLNVSEGIAVGVSLVKEKQGKYYWDSSEHDVTVKDKNGNKPGVKWATEDDSYAIYTGILKSDKKIKTNNGEVNPPFHKKTGIYYYVEKNNSNIYSSNICKLI